MNWYYVNTAGQQAGPVDDAALDALGASGAVNAGTLVWSEGMPNWQPHRDARPNAVNLPAGAVAAAPGSAAAVNDEVVCAECGGVFSVNDTIRIGNSRVCAKCKPVFVQKMREGMRVMTAGFDSNQKYGGFWIRVAAKILDNILLNIVITVPAFMVFGLAMTGIGRNGNPAAIGAILFFELILFLLIIGGQIVYSWIFLAKYGATPGKMACGLKVIKEDGSQPSYGLSFGRALSEWLSYMTCYIGFIMVAFDDEKRGLHDRICNTRVIYK